MSAQPISLVPKGPLTDDVFVFNQDHFLQILDYQKRDLGFLSSPPVRALVDAGNVVGGAATGITSGVGHAAQDVSTGLFGVAGKATGPIGGGLLGQAQKDVTGVIGTTEGVAEHLVDPSRVVREHITYSNDIHDNLTPAVTAVDNSIREFSVEIGNKIHEIHENVATNGIPIATALESRVAEVVSGLANLILVLTRNNVQENIRVGQDKYHGIIISGGLINFLGPIGDLLPKVIASITVVKGAFETIQLNLGLVKARINKGVTDPKQIFAESHEDVSEAWKAYEVKRKTLTYLPYNH